MRVPKLAPSSPRVPRRGRVAPAIAWSLLAVGLGWSAGVVWSVPVPAAGEREHGDPTPAQVVEFYCPMHPSYHASRAGDCPLCNMAMVPLEGGAAPASATVAGHATVELTSERLQLVGLRTEAVESRPCTRTLRVPGRVEVDEDGLSAVSLKTTGWVEELFVRSVGATVEPGQPLFTLYSPELFEAQRKYILASSLLAQNLAGGGAELEASKRQQVEATRARLALWDMDEAQIRALEQPGAEPLSITPIVARAGGVVLRRDIVKGARVEPGEALFELADLTRVWVLAEVFEADLMRVASGAAVEIELAGRPGASLAGTVDYVYPLLDAATRTARVRIVLENPEGLLRPGMYATVSIGVALGEQLLIDDEAVLDTGLRKLVFVELAPGRYEPREVEIGQRFDGRALVLAGLEEGERIVTSGTFLIDSESRMQAALRAFGRGTPTP